jgi:hypothetical protein
VGESHNPDMVGADQVEDGKRKMFQAQPAYRHIVRELSSRRKTVGSCDSRLERRPHVLFEPEGQALASVLPIKGNRVLQLGGRVWMKPEPFRFAGHLHGLERLKGVYAFNRASFDFGESPADIVLKRGIEALGLRRGMDAPDKALMQGEQIRAREFAELLFQFFFGTPRGHCSDIAAEASEVSKKPVDQMRTFGIESRALRFVAVGLWCEWSHSSRRSERWKIGLIKSVVCLNLVARETRTTAASASRPYWGRFNACAGTGL